MDEVSRIWLNAKWDWLLRQAKLEGKPREPTSGANLRSVWRQHVRKLLPFPRVMLKAYNLDWPNPRLA